MSISFSSILSLIEIIIPGIQTAERFIRGRGRGPEKRDTVTEQTIEHISEIAKEALKNSADPIHASYNWIGLLGAIPEISEKVGAVIDALVALFNLLKRFEVAKPDVPKKLVN